MAWRAALAGVDGHTHRRRLAEIGRLIRDDDGAPPPSTFWRETFATLLAAAEERLSASPWPDALTPIFRAAFARIATRLETERDRFFRDDSDDMLKELAVLTLTAVPAGPRIVLLAPGCPRTLLGRPGSPVATLQWLRIQWRLGRGPVVRSHVHQPMRHCFHEAGIRFGFLVIAEVLRHDTRLRGWIANGWYYDPVLTRISPRLAFVRQIPLRGGAFSCRGVNVASTVADALMRSETRRAMYDAGQYRPQSHLVVWPREALLRWAEAQPREPLIALHDRLSDG
jgi:hypothetical protein